MRRKCRRQLAFQRYALEVFAEVFNPILWLPATRHRHEACNHCRVVHAVGRIVVVADLELVGHYRCFDLRPSSTSRRMALDWELTAKAVRLFHFARVAERVQCALMLIVQENGKL